MNIFAPFRLASLFCALLLAALPLIAQDDGNPGQGPVPAPAPPDSGGDQGDGSASFQTFYDTLGSQGNWIQTNQYGYVWQPPVTDPDWAPYTDGRWVTSDDNWVWDTDEPWGWATYHYGRWANLDGVGWVWVPGYTWAPAWVSWRYGNGYCGWAPLPPDSFAGIDYEGDGFAISVGFHIGGDCDDFYGIGAGCYHFLPVGCMGYRNYHGYYAHHWDNYAIINHTTNVTNINVTRNGGHEGSGGSPEFRSGYHHVTTGGPSFAQVNAASESPVPRVNLVPAHEPGGSRLENNSLALYAPRVDPGTRGTARPSNIGGTIGEARINRGTDITRPLQVNSRLTPAAPTSEQIQQAQFAQQNAPAHAKIATSQTEVRSSFNKPLTSYQPTVESHHNQSSGFSTSPGTSYVPHSNAGPGGSSAPAINTSPSTSFAPHSVVEPNGSTAPSINGNPNYTPTRL